MLTMMDLKLAPVVVRVGYVQRVQNAQTVGKLVRIFLDDMSQIIVFQAAYGLQVTSEDSQLHHFEHMGSDVRNPLAQVSSAPEPEFGGVRPGDRRRRRIRVGRVPVSRERATSPSAGSRLSPS